MHPRPPDSPISNNARDSLRHATASLHERVDACMPLARPDATLDDYQRHLAMLRAWVHGLRQLRPSLAPRLAQEAGALDADLAQCRQILDQPSPCYSATPSPESTRWTAPAQADDFDWGIAYVMEGSRLGGQVLYRRLCESLAPHRLDYLRGAGSLTGPRWKTFLAELGDALDTPQRIQRACDGAVMAFELLLHCHAGGKTTAEATP